MKTKKLKTLKKELWKLVSEYVRRSHANENGYVACYTCGAIHLWTEVDAGHAIGGHSNSVMFDLSIIRPQCKKCNMPPGCGEYYIFGTKLNKENGIGWYEQKKIDSHKTIKFTRSQLEDMIDDFKQKIAELEYV